MPGSIGERFHAAHRRSALLHAEAATRFPSGVTHDVRHFEPFPIYIDRAAGARKWDVDGSEIIDYVMGHGALLFGHAHPTLVRAVRRQIERGTHYGGSHAGEIAWARAVRAVLPGAESIRFTSSGTEATMLAVRLARAATGREKILKLRYHFHGWNDSLAGGARTSAGAISSLGVPASLQEALIVVGQHDRGAIGAALDAGDVAAAICEPSGYAWGAAPLEPATLEFLRERTTATGAVLIFDEVVTGFRVSQGGVQELLGIRPDLTTLAKILAGGLPGGAVAGRADLIDQIAFPADATDPPRPRVNHPGTFNANPLSAAAGRAALEEVATGEPGRIAAARAQRLCRGLNAALRRAEAPGAAYGEASMIHILLGHEVPPPDDDLRWQWGPDGTQSELPVTPPEVLWPFRQSLLNHGVDLIGMGALVSCVHSEADIDATIEAFADALQDLRRDAIL